MSKSQVGRHSFNELFTITLKDCNVGSRHRLEVDLTHHGRAIFEGGFKIKNFFINVRLDYNENVSIVEDRVKRKITNKNKLIVVLKIVKRPGGKPIVATNLILVCLITYADEVEAKELSKKTNTPESIENDSGEEIQNDSPIEENENDLIVEEIEIGSPVIERKTIAPVNSSNKSSGIPITRK